jgi:hypothetical protein
MKKSTKYLLLTLATLVAIVVDHFTRSAHVLFPLMGMAWPTTGAYGNGNAASGQYAASGSATTLVWGTNNFMAVTGWLTILKISQRTIVAFKEELPNGDGLTAGQVLGIDGFRTEIEVRDDTSQVVSGLQVGQRILVTDGGGLYPGGGRGAQYTGTIVENGWDTAPKTAAGRTLTVEKFILIS